MKMAKKLNFFILIFALIFASLSYADTPPPANYTITLTNSHASLTHQQKENTFLLEITSPQIIAYPHLFNPFDPSASTAKNIAIEKFLLAWRQQTEFKGIIACAGKKFDPIFASFSNPLYNKEKNTLTFIIKPFKKINDKTQGNLLPCSTPLIQLPWFLDLEGK